MLTKFVPFLSKQFRQLNTFNLCSVKTTTKAKNNYKFIKMFSTNTSYNYEYLNVTKAADFVTSVELNRPNKRNAMNIKFFQEIKDCFENLSKDSDCRVVILSAAGKLFSTGIDLMTITEIATNTDQALDVCRKGKEYQILIDMLQQSMSSPEKCNKPVIAAVHNGCLGGGMDLITACDIRICTEDAYFNIKEVDLGLAADIGSLQRIHHCIGSSSMIRELVYTAKNLTAPEAYRCGLVSHVFSDKEKMLEEALKLASTIAEKSPVAVQSSKISLNYSRDHTTDESLEHIKNWNRFALQSEDVVTAAISSAAKEKPIYSKL